MLAPMCKHRMVSAVSAEFPYTTAGKQVRVQLQKRKLLLERILDSIEPQHKIAAAAGA